MPIERCLHCPECGKNVKAKGEKVCPLQCLNCGVGLSYVREEREIKLKALPILKK